MLTDRIFLSTICSMSTLPTELSDQGKTARRRMYRRLAAGKAQRVLSGVLVEGDALLGEADVMALLNARQPLAVMNLISALSHHRMTTQIPDALYVALPRGVRMPCVYAMPVRVWYTTPELLEGCWDEIAGAYGPYRVTTPERTVVDCFKYRNKIGLSIFLEALRLGQEKLNPFLLHSEAERLRVLNKMSPYLKYIFS